MPCIDAITPSCPKRGMSAALRCCACSMRQRRSFASGLRLERALVDVQHLAIGAVADGVHAQLHAGVDRDLRGRPRCSRAERVVRPVLAGESAYGSSIHAPREPSAPSAVTLIAAIVRCLSPRPTALYRASFAREVARCCRAPSPTGGCRAAVGGRLLVDVDGREVRAGVLKAGDALFESSPAPRARSAGARRRAAPPASSSRATPRARGSTMPGGGFAQHADRPPGCVLENLAARRIRRLRGHARRLHGLRVDEARVAAGVREHHRVVRRHLAERVVKRKALDVRLRARSPTSPGASRGRGSTRRASPSSRRPPTIDDDLVPVLHVHQVELHLRLAEAHEVAVALDEPGNRELPGEIDHLGGRADVALDARRWCRRRRCDRREPRSPAPPASPSSTVTILPLRSTSVAGSTVDCWLTRQRTTE